MSEEKRPRRGFLENAFSDDTDYKLLARDVVVGTVVAALFSAAVSQCTGKDIGEHIEGWGNAEPSSGIMHDSPDDSSFAAYDDNLPDYTA